MVGWRTITFHLFPICRIEEWSLTHSLLLKKDINMHIQSDVLLIRICLKSTQITRNIDKYNAVKHDNRNADACVQIVSDHKHGMSRWLSSLKHIPHSSNIPNLNPTIDLWCMLSLPFSLSHISCRPLHFSNGQNIILKNIKHKSTTAETFEVNYLD